MKIKVLIGFLLTFLIFSQESQSYDSGFTHPDILTKGGTDLIAPNPLSPYKEVSEFFSRNGNFNDLREGSIDEDGIFGPFRVSNDEPYYRPVSVANHFYNPQTGKGLALFDSALDIAPYFWNKAIAQYSQNNKEFAYYYLGRLAHLAEDLGSAPHTHSDLHLSMGNAIDNLLRFGQNDYEHWVANNSSFASQSKGTQVLEDNSPTEILHKTLSCNNN